MVVSHKRGLQFRPPTGYVVLIFGTLKTVPDFLGKPYITSDSVNPSQMLN